MSPLTQKRGELGGLASNWFPPSGEYEKFCVDTCLTQALCEHVPLHRRIEHLIDSTEVLGPRVTALCLRIDKRTTVSIINCYATMSTAAGGEKNVIYEKLEKVDEDFNAIIHEERPATARTGPQGENN
ncbi:unnamed protein product [Haemonchus placei]|uniref:Disease resistance protein n=1 Tax=Haemonchus placei TaxID=6290 RepID=A0A0N4X0N3_HAEPC|nr:unnamed protein product [Haemonchus placei]